MSLGPATTAQVGAANVLPADGGPTYLFTYLPNYSPTYLLAYILPTYLITYLITNIKGVHKKTRSPETLKGFKSKTWRPRKLRLHQPVYLIR